MNALIYLVLVVGSLVGIGLLIHYRELHGADVWGWILILVVWLVGLARILGLTTHPRDQ